MLSRFDVFGVPKTFVVSYVATVEQWLHTSRGSKGSLRMKSGVPGGIPSSSTAGCGCVGGTAPLPVAAAENNALAAPGSARACGCVISGPGAHVS